MKAIKVFEKRIIFSFERRSSKREKKYGGKSKKETPVTMPNTAVKLLHAESSWWETACEGRTLPCLWRISSAGRASALQAGGHRFEPCILHSESLAQLVEHLTFNQRVDGSSPSRLMAPFCGCGGIGRRARFRF